MKMKKKRLLILLLLLLGTHFVSAGARIYITKLNMYKKEADVSLTSSDGTVTKLVQKSIKKADFEGLLNVQNAPESSSFSGKIIKSSFDASELCDLLRIDYLIYGFVEKSHKYYNAEIRLFENKTKTDRKIFYVKTDEMDIDVVTGELSEKFVRYMYSILGLTKEQKDRKRGFGGIGIYYANGYWFPLGSYWPILTGLVSFELGINVIPVAPIVKKRNFSYYLRYGLYTSYSLGMNKPGLLTSYLNSIVFRIPAEACFELFFRNVFIIGLGPQMQLDILYQQLLYDGDRTVTTAAFSLFCSAGFEHWFGKRKRFAMGVTNIFDFTFYDNVFFNYKLDFYITIRIPTMKEELPVSQTEKKRPFKQRI